MIQSFYFNNKKLYYQVKNNDNASFHKSKESEEIVKATGYDLMFLPSYSPDLNPIKLFWAKLKTKIKQIIHKFKTLENAIDYAFQAY